MCGNDNLHFFSFNQKKMDTGTSVPNKFKMFTVILCEWLNDIADDISKKTFQNMVIIIYGKNQGWKIPLIIDVILTCRLRRKSGRMECWEIVSRVSPTSEGSVLLAVQHSVQGSQGKAGQVWDGGKPTQSPGFWGPSLRLFLGLSARNDHSSRRESS